jgi:hypothetical protein
MWRLVDMVQTDVSEERIASIFRIFNKNQRARNQHEQVATAARKISWQNFKLVRSEVFTAVTVKNAVF